MKSSSESKENMSEVVKTNRLNMAIQNLSLAEIRLVQVAIIDCREKQQGLSADKPLRVHALRYAKAFGITPQTAYEALINAEKTLFERRFTFIDEKDGNQVRSRWISQAKYLKSEGAIEIILSPAVIAEITRIDGYIQKYTSYMLEQTATLKSVYSVRLYELLVQWLEAKKTNPMQLQTIRSQMGLGINDYKRMSDFKRRVLDLAVNEINEKTDLNVSYTQEKAGRIIQSFRFKVLPKLKAKIKEENIKVDNGDMFVIDGYSDAQLARITRNANFINDYASRVAPTSSINQSMTQWTAHFIKELKKDPSQFNKRPTKDYLD